MEWFTSFRDQMIECTNTGNSFILYWYDDEIIVCVPFKTWCQSKACRRRRIDGISKSN